MSQSGVRCSGSLPARRVAMTLNAVGSITLMVLSASLGTYTRSGRSATEGDSVLLVIADQTFQAREAAAEASSRFGWEGSPSGTQPLNAATETCHQRTPLNTIGPPTTCTSSPAPMTSACDEGATEPPLGAACGLGPPGDSAARNPSTMMRATVPTPPTGVGSGVGIWVGDGLAM